ncbi:uncharacterized protein LOC135688032 isoform X1 [Rhopilema esculentum]|uniref:uncharacterized protein LOC135688032 isoform X1 n=2 Tax=Rhopilema esculentum TaxID=499914 RepID=UPI0031D95D03
MQKRQGGKEKRVPRKQFESVHDVKESLRRNTELFYSVLPGKKMAESGVVRRPRKPFKVGRQNKIFKGIVANSLSELKSKSCQVFGFGSSVELQVFLEEDMTEIEDEEYFNFLPEQTRFLIYTASEVPGKEKGLSFIALPNLDVMDEAHEPTKLPEMKCPSDETLQTTKILENFETKLESKNPDSALMCSPVECSEEQPETDTFYCQAIDILNKLEFDKLAEQMKSLQINTIEKLKGVVDLIYEKGLSNPKACAMLCYEISETKMRIEDIKGSNVSFKKILLNKCQTELEKEKSDEQQLESEQDKRYENAEKQKAWQQNLVFRRHEIKRCSLQKIRFIGELFNLKMLTEAIMHTCITKLLKDRVEESLECLCKLVTTIGKDIDHEKAKPWTNKYFDQIDKIINQKKVSSRIIFMLQDLKDLRQSNWVSRVALDGPIVNREMTSIGCPQSFSVDYDTPKTIGEIHKEAKQEEVQMHMAHQTATKRKLTKKGGKRKTGSRFIPENYDSKVELKKSENAWVRSSERAKEPAGEGSEVEALTRLARGILNKLTPQKFDKLVEQMKSLPIDSVEKLKCVIDLIFEKALSEPISSKLYAQLCDEISRKKISIESGKGSNVSFKRILLNMCQFEFEKEKSDEQQLEKEQDKHYENADEEKAWQEELALKRQKTKRRSLGNIRFIGELFNLKMLTEAIMHTCITKLLKDRDEESLECLCKLVTTIGKDIDHEKAKPWTNKYFDQIDKIINQKKVSSRIIFMLQDLKNLRQSNWVSRVALDGPIVNREMTSIGCPQSFSVDYDTPKTIGEIHKEAKQEEVQIQMAHQTATKRKLTKKGGNRKTGSRFIPENYDSKVELKKSESVWVCSSERAKEPAGEESEIEALTRLARGILNKLNLQTFDRVVEQMKSLPIDSVEKLKCVVYVIFEKALSEPISSKLYAQLCDEISRKKISIESGKGSNVSFKRILLNMCQFEFEKEKSDEQQLEKEQDKHYENADEEKAWQEELALKRQKTKRRSLGNIRFIGELFNLKMLTEAIMHTCITKLLNDRNEESLECLCKLVTTIGKDIDHEKAKPRTNQYFDQVDKIINQKKVSSRIIFMLQDLKDLRRSNWVARRILDAP